MLKEYLLLFLVVLATINLTTGQLWLNTLPMHICKKNCGPREAEVKALTDRCEPGLKYCEESHMVEGECGYDNGRFEKKHTTTISGTRCRQACEETEIEYYHQAICDPGLICCREKSVLDKIGGWFSSRR